MREVVSVPTSETVRWDMVMSPERIAGFRMGVEAAIAIMVEHGQRHGVIQAVQPRIVADIIRERLLNDR